MFRAHASTSTVGARERRTSSSIRFRALAPRCSSAAAAAALAHAARRTTQTLRWFRTTLLGRCRAVAPGPRRSGRGARSRSSDAAHARRRRAPRAAAPRRDDRRSCSTSTLARHGALAGQSRPTRAVGRAGGDRAERRSAALDADGDAVAVRASSAIAATSRPWWPHTHGAPASTTCASRSTATPGRRSRSTAAASGFRTIELDTADGRFGAARQRRAGLLPRRLLDADRRRRRSRRRRRATRSRSSWRATPGMNMLRVGGTMLYETDDVLRPLRRARHPRLAGLHVRQHGLPGRRRRRSRAASSARRAQFLGRLAARPCLAVLCGSSEVEQQAAMLGLPPSSGAARSSTRCCPRSCARAARRTCPTSPSTPERRRAAVPRRTRASRTTTASARICVRSTTPAAPTCASPPSASRFANVPGRRRVERCSARRRVAGRTTRAGRRACRATRAPAGTSRTCAITTSASSSASIRPRLRAERPGALPRRSRASSPAR